MSQETTNSSIGDDEDRRLDAKDADVEVLEPEDKSLLLQVENNPRVMHVFQRRFHAGPLPPPEDMAEYNHVIPNGADRIMAMAEKEQDGRLSQAAKSNDSYFRMKARGQWFSLGVVVMFTVLAAYLFSKEQYGLGVSLLGANLVSIIAIFIADRYFHNKDED